MPDESYTPYMESHGYYDTGHVHDALDYALFSGDIHQLMANSPDYAFIRLLSIL